MSVSEAKRAAFVLAVRARGSDARDVRDAAHEACHALEWRVTKKWTRDNVHARKPRSRSEGVRSEILARAVEQLVSASLGYDCGSVEHWAFVCSMEMVKNERIALPSIDWLVASVRSVMESAQARKWADAVMAVANANEHAAVSP